MKTNIWMKKFLAILGSAVMGTMFTTVADATKEPVTAQVTFAGAISITENNALQFGVIDEVLNTEDIIIATNDGVTGSGTGLILGGTQAAATLTIDATSGVVFLILVDNVLPGTGYALDTFVCSYDGGTDTDCDGPGDYTPTSILSGTLKIGATLTGDNLATAGPADGSFDVTVTYF